MSGPLTVQIGETQRGADIQDYGVSVGVRNYHCGEHSTIIGNNSSAVHNSSIALGNGAVTTSDNQFVFNLGKGKEFKTNLDIDVGAGTLGVNIHGSDYNIPLGPTGGGGGASVNSYPSFTAQGQLTYAAGSDDGDHLPIGAAHRILLSNGSGPYWGNTVRIAPGDYSAPSLCFDTDSDTGIYQVAPDYLGFVAGGNETFAINTTGCLTNAQFSCGTLQILTGAADGRLLVSNGSGIMTLTDKHLIGSTRKFNRVTADFNATLANSDDTVNEIDWSTNNSTILVRFDAYALGSANSTHRGSRWYVGDIGTTGNLIIECTTGAHLYGSVSSSTGGSPPSIAGQNTVTVNRGAFATGDWFEVHPLNGKICISGHFKDGSGVFVA